MSVLGFVPPRPWIGPWRGMECVQVAQCRPAREPRYGLDQPVCPHEKN